MVQRVEPGWTDWLVDIWYDVALSQTSGRIPGLGWNAKNGKQRRLAMISGDGGEGSKHKIGQQSVDLHNLGDI